MADEESTVSKEIVLEEGDFITHDSAVGRQVALVIFKDTSSQTIVVRSGIVGRSRFDKESILALNVKKIEKTDVIDYLHSLTLDRSRLELRIEHIKRLTNE